MHAAAIVVNRQHAHDLEQFRRQCRRAAAAGGWAASFLDTSRDDAGDGLARGAVAAGAGLIVAAGGDGTVRACAQAVAGTGIPLAIVPLGTGNLAARALGIPLRTGDALAVAFSGHDHQVDLATADGMPFLSMAGMGLDATVVSATPQLLKDRLGWLGYALAGLARLPGQRHVFTVRLDDGPPLTRLARSVVVGNAGLLPGGFTLLPDARMDDGTLDVGILAPAGLLGWAVVAGRVLARSRRDDRRLERFRARRVQIQAADTLPRQSDGEMIGPGRSLTVRLAGG